MSSPPDRAAVVTTSILLIVATAMRRWLDGEPIPRAALRTELRTRCGENSPLSRAEYAASATRR